MIDLEQLNNALSGITAVGRREHRFSVAISDLESVEIVFIPTTAEADREVFEYAQTAVEGKDLAGREDQAASIDYMAKFRIAAVSHAIVKISDLDLSKEEDVLTGNLLKDGTPQKVRRYQAIRAIIEDWPTAIIDQLFLQFSEMQRVLEAEAARSIRYEPADVNAEIDLLKDRLDFLLKELEKRENPPVAETKRIRDEIGRITKAQQKYKRGLSETSPEPNLAPEKEPSVDLKEETGPPPEDSPKPAQPPVKDHIAARRSVPPPAPRAEKPPEATQNFAEKFLHENPDIPPGEDLMQYTPTGDSLIGDDEKSALEAEGRRQAILRQRRIQSELEARKEQPRPQGAPPHVAAREAARTVEEAAKIEDADPGTPTYQLPTEILDRRAKQQIRERKAGTIELNKPSCGSTNPRFVGRGRQR